MDAVSVHDEEDTRQAEKLEKRTKADADRVLLVLKKNPEGLSRNQIRDAAGMSFGRTVAAIEALQKADRIVGEPSARRGGGWTWKAATLPGRSAA